MDILDKDNKLTQDSLIAQAKEVLGNPAFILAFKELEEGEWIKFKASQRRDDESREKIYCFVKALNEVKGRLTSYLSDEIVKKSKEKTLEEKFLERFDLA